MPGLGIWLTPGRSSLPQRPRTWTLSEAFSWDQVNLWIRVSGMFCFCLQSSLLKLQALEVEGGPSLGPSPEESPPALGSKGQRSPCGPAELRGKEEKTLVLCHGVPPEDSSLPGTGLTCLDLSGPVCLSVCSCLCLSVPVCVCLFLSGSTCLSVPTLIYLQDLVIGQYKGVSRC